MINNKTDLLPRITVIQLVDAYQRSNKMIAEAYHLLLDAQQLMLSSFGKDGTHHGYNWLATPQSYNQQPMTALENVGRAYKRDAWSNIIGRLELEKIMSLKDKEAFDKRMEDPDNMPEIEEGAIFDMLNLLRENSSKMAKDLVLEVYDYLVPGTRDGNKYVTNRKEARQRLGKRVILTGMANPNRYYKAYDQTYAPINEHSAKYLALDRVFAMLDGKPGPELWYGILYQTMAENAQKGIGEGETEYFKYKAHYNGTLHLFFKRPDLVAAINQIAGGKYILHN